MKRRNFFAQLFAGILAFIFALFGLKPKTKTPKGYFIAEFKYATRPVGENFDEIIFFKREPHEPA